MRGVRKSIFRQNSGVTILLGELRTGGYTRRKREAKKLKKLQELTEQIDDDRDYITVPEAVAMS